MKFLVDTCAWIEWIVNGKLASKIQPYLKNLDQIAMPTIIQFELYKWACREHDETFALILIGTTEQTQVLALDTSLALFAADTAKQYKLAMADAIIYASSLKNNLLLVTCDKHFKQLPEVKYLSKA